MQYVLLMTTCATREEAKSLSLHLIERRLAGCVQVVGPIASTYRREDRTESVEEWLCLIKSSHELYPRIMTAIEGNHSYETPEIVVFPVLAGSERYFDWLRTQLQRD